MPKTYRGSFLYGLGFAVIVFSLNVLMFEDGPLRYLATAIGFIGATVAAALLVRVRSKRNSTVGPRS